MPRPRPRRPGPRTAALVCSTQAAHCPSDGPPCTSHLDLAAEPKKPRTLLASHQIAGRPARSPACTTRVLPCLATTLSEHSMHPRRSECVRDSSSDPERRLLCGQVSSTEISRFGSRNAPIGFAARALPTETQKPRTDEHMVFRPCPRPACRTTRPEPPRVETHPHPVRQGSLLPLRGPQPAPPPQPTPDQSIPSRPCRWKSRHLPILTLPRGQVRWPAPGDCRGCDETILARAGK